MVLNFEKLSRMVDLRCAEHKTVLAELKKNPNETHSRKLSEKMQAVNAISGLVALHKLIDEDEMNARLYVSGIDGTPIKVIGNNGESVNPLPYINVARPMEISLIASQFNTDEYAILMVFRGKHGSIAFVKGMRPETTAVYGVARTCDNNVNSTTCERILTEYLILEKQCGSFVFRSAPIYFDNQTMELEDVPRKVDIFLKRIGLTGGYLPWHDKRISMIFGLAEPDWWKDV